MEAKGEAYSQTALQRMNHVVRVHSSRAFDKAFDMPDITPVTIGSAWTPKHMLARQVTPLALALKKRLQLFYSSHPLDSLSCQGKRRGASLCLPSSELSQSPAQPNSLLKLEVRTPPCTYRLPPTPCTPQNSKAPTLYPPYPPTPSHPLPPTPTHSRPLFRPLHTPSIASPYPEPPWSTQPPAPRNAMN